MGFLKFLKREKKEDNLTDLDLPPSPPPLEGFDENLNLPDFPDFDEQKMPSPPEMPDFEQHEKEEPIPMGDDNLPEFPDFPEQEEPAADIPPVSSPTIQKAEPIPEPEPEPAGSSEITAIDTYQKRPARLFSREKAVHERPAGKTIYVRVDRFKATLGSINMVRNDLRKSEEALAKLENLKTAKDRSFDKLRSSLDDLQKKLIFVDKTLFKGD